MIFGRKIKKTNEVKPTTDDTKLKSVEAARDTLEKEILIKNRYITSLEEENKRLHNLAISKDNTI